LIKKCFAQTQLSQKRNFFRPKIFFIKKFFGLNNFGEKQILPKHLYTKKICICTDGKISFRINFPPSSQLVYLCFCPFVAITTLSTGLVGVEVTSVSWNTCTGIYKHLHTHIQTVSYLHDTQILPHTFTQTKTATLTHIHTFIEPHVKRNVHIQTHIHTEICTHIYTYINIHTLYVHKHAHTKTYIYTNTCTHTILHTVTTQIKSHKLTHTRKHTHTNTDTHIHTYIQNTIHIYTKKYSQTQIGTYTEI